MQYYSEQRKLHYYSKQRELYYYSKQKKITLLVLFDQSVIYGTVGYTEIKYHQIS